MNQLTDEDISNCRRDWFWKLAHDSIDCTTANNETDATDYNTKFP
ncbi:MAG: hypothetical protein V7K57_24530 [Nostoc sp.]